ncbi:delta-like protein 4, partial [Biomphalaria glabrata]
MMKYFCCCLLFLNTLGHQIFIADYTPTCAVGWFGSSCQFKCRCQLPCHSNGECPGGCQTGWFGHKCQYQDLITSAQASLVLNGGELSRLRDNNERTCITERTVTVDLKMEFYFSWLRAVINYSQNYSLNVVFQNSNQQNVTCKVKRKIEVDKKYLDYQCFSTIRVRYVTLHVAGCQICSLWISGGKNVALKLFTNQSTTYHDRGQSFNAVDGNTDSDYFKGSCTHTDLKDANPNWQLVFRPPALINRIVIYNRQGPDSKRLKQFSLTTLNVDNIWSNGVPCPSKHKSPEKRLKMIAIDGPRDIPNNNEVFLTLCEVEAYEECPKDLWGLECEQFCKSTCEDGCRQDDGRCTEYCIGYSDPPSCSKECPEGSWGANCLKTCSPSCSASNKCDKITGECLDGCKPGFQMPSCEQKCIDGLFGANCSQPCSVFCEDKPCHYRDGTCTQCRPGYRGRHCSQTCDFGFYGRNCSEKCSPFCKYEICYPETGLCKSCIPGYRGGFCNEECQEGKWGDNCSSPCSSNCITYDTCNKMTGECQGGCKPGFQTPNCEK